MSEYVKVCKVSDVPPGECHVVELEKVAVVIANVEDKLFALNAECTHSGGLLKFMMGDEIMCQWHGGRFNVKTGDATSFPATGCVPKYRVRTVGDDVEVELPSP